MFLGVLGDTHRISAEIIAQATLDMVNRGVDLFIHTGDIEINHCLPELFHHKPVVCALTRQQQFDHRFTFPPAHWAFTKPGNNLVTMPTNEDRENAKLRDSIASRLGIANRIVNVDGTAFYVGHERSYDVMLNAERFNEFIGLINLVYDGVRFVLTGHTHHQFLVQRNGVSWINPGSIDIGVSRDYEYAMVDTETGEIIFTRLPYAVSNFNPVTVGIISDVGNVSDRNEKFWEKLRQEFKRRDVSVVIIDGELLSRDIGRPEFFDFQVYYSPSLCQNNDHCPNWHPILAEDPIIEICGNNFLVKHSIGIDLDGRTEKEMIDLVRAESKKYRHIDIVVCGGIHNALFEEHDEVMIINSGDARNHEKFATVCFRPHTEVTFSEVSK